MCNRPEGGREPNMSEAKDVSVVNPQDAQRKSSQSKSKLLAAAAVFEKNIQQNKERGVDSSLVGAGRRKMMPRSRKGMQPEQPTSPVNTTRVNKLTVSQSPILSPGRKGQLRAGFKREMSARRMKLLVEKEEENTGTESEPPRDLNASPRPEEAGKMLRGPQRWSDKNKLSRESKLQEFQQLQKKREEEANLLEQRKLGQKIDNIRSSVDHYDKTIEKNKEFGFQARLADQTKQLPPRRLTDLDAAAAEIMEDQEHESEHEHSDDIIEEDMVFIGDDQSLTLEQLQHDSGVRKPKATNNPPSRLPSHESTLSPIHVPAKQQASYSNLATADCPIPKFITFGPDSLDDSDITLPCRLAPSNKLADSRWDSHPSKKYHTTAQEQDPICYRLPQPCMLQESQGRWSVHPRVVYGPPKTEMAVQPPPDSAQTRWAATAPGKKKKGPQFPQNSSRWASATSTRVKGGPTKNGSRLPKRQATRNGIANGAVLPQKPRRQTTNERILVPTPELPHQATKDGALDKTKSMPMVDRSDKDDNVDISLNPKFKMVRDKLLSRNLSLGQVKEVCAAIRIQSILRMYMAQYQCKMKQQERCKDEIEKETAKELQFIRDCVLRRQQSLKVKMERDHQAGVTVESFNDNDPTETYLRKEIAELEQSNQKLASQCERLLASNNRMQGGNKTRDVAVKEVQGRLTKLQHIQKKLYKVKQDFQMEQAAIQQKFDQVNLQIKQEQALQATTKACLGKIVTLVRSKLSTENQDLIGELEDVFAIDCAM